MIDGSLVVNKASAVLVYIALISGIHLFVIPRSNGLALNALAWGAVYGLICYMTYDFTALAIMKGWTWRFAIIDVIWGGVLCAITSWVATLVR